MLVVRLKTKEKTIEAYRNAGNTKVADRIEADKKKENLGIIDAFEREFRFCPVRFIFSDDTRKLQARDTISLLNSDMTVAYRGTIKDTFYLLAEYGLPLDNVRERGDEPKHYMETTEGTTPSGSQGFIVMDTAGKQLQPPFPAVVFPNPISAQASQLPGAITRLNARLFSFFTTGPASVQRKIRKGKK